MPGPTMVFWKASIAACPIATALASALASEGDDRRSSDQPRRRPPAMEPPRQVQQQQPFSCLGNGPRRTLTPVPRQQIVDPVGRMLGDASQYVGEPVEAIQAPPL
jgi:hypothetical protein